MGMENTTKDVSGTWRVNVAVMSTTNVWIYHRKREICIQKRFELEWQLRVVLEQSMNCLSSLNFHVGIPTNQPFKISVALELNDRRWWISKSIQR